MTSVVRQDQEKLVLRPGRELPDNTFYALLNHDKTMEKVQWKEGSNDELGDRFNTASNEESDGYVVADLKTACYISFMLDTTMDQCWLAECTLPRDCQAWCSLTSQIFCASKIQVARLTLVQDLFDVDPQLYRQTMLAAMFLSPKVFRTVNPKLASDDQFLLQAVMQNAFVVRYMPDNLVSKELAFTAANKNPYSIVHLPERVRTQELWFHAVSQAGDLLELAPKDMITDRMCLAAVNNDGAALVFVPPELVTESLCMTAVSKEPLALVDVPERFQSEDVCTAAVIGNPKTIIHVSNDLLRMELEGNLAMYQINTDQSQDSTDQPQAPNPTQRTETDK